MRSYGPLRRILPLVVLEKLLRRREEQHGLIGKPALLMPTKQSMGNAVNSKTKAGLWDKVNFIAGRFRLNFPVRLGRRAMLMMLLLPWILAMNSSQKYP
jgi:hypothetical protein